MNSPIDRAYEHRITPKKKHRMTLKKKENIHFPRSSPKRRLSMTMYYTEKRKNSSKYILSERHIPSRTSSCVRGDIHQLCKQKKKGATNNIYTHLLHNAIVGPRSNKIFQYNQAKIDPLESTFFKFPIRVNRCQSRSTKETERIIPKKPIKILDAPYLKDNFYSNLLDWSSQNVAAIVLGSSVYLWSGYTKQVSQLGASQTQQYFHQNDSITSLVWNKEGTHLALGTKKW